MQSWRANLTALTILIVVALAAYSNTFRVPFVYDDLGGIVGNQAALKDFNLLEPRSYFGLRSLPQASLAANYQLGGIETLWHWHAASLALHIANGYLVWWLVVTLVGRRNGTAFMASLIFVAHPIATEAVTYISQRAVLVVTFFYLLAVVAYVRWRAVTPRDRPDLPLPLLSKEGKTMAATASFLPLPRGGWSSEARRRGIWAALSLIATLLAMHSKQVAVSLPIMILWVEICFFATTTTPRHSPGYSSLTQPSPRATAGEVRGRKILERLPKLLPWLILLFYIPWRMFGGLPVEQVVTELVDTGGRDLYEQTESTNVGDTPLAPTTYWLTQTGIWLTYFKVYASLAAQSIDHDFAVVESLFNFSVLGWLILTLVLVTAAFKTWRKHRLVALGTGWFFIAMALESLFPLLEPIAEYRMYLPSVGLAMLVALGLSVLSKKSVLAIETWFNIDFGKQTVSLTKWILAVGFIWILILVTWQRNAVWQDPIRLWEDVIEKAPNKARGYNNLGYVLLEHGELEMAEINFRRAVELKPGYAHAYHNLGTALAGQASQIYGQEKFDAAITAYQRAIKLDERQKLSVLNLATVYLTSGQDEEARLLLVEQLADDSFEGPLRARAHVILGAVYFESGDVARARSQFEAALEADPTNESARNNLNLINSLP